MKQIMEHYAGAIIAGIVTIALLGIIFGFSYGKGQGMPKVLGEITDVALSKAQDMNGTTDAFEKHMAIIMPEISVADSYACVAKEWIMVSDCLVATDDNGQHIPVFVDSGWSAGGTDGTITVSGDGTEIYASKPGIYWLAAYVCTENGNSRNVIVKLIVNEEVVA